MITEEDIFEAAAALPQKERTAYLEAACAGHPEMAKRLEALLRSHDVTGFMDMPTADAVSERSGEQIGRYRLVQQIGEGGFGVVWMAEQVEPVTRTVALKIIKPGMDAKEVIARFEAERQVLALMDHPNIVKLFDAGATEKRRPYFVTELVKGIPVTRFCDEQQFTIRRRLELFADVCSAITHAHQKGIIHRNLKPSNVLVTLEGEKPVPKVIDFGIAKAVAGRLPDKTLSTRVEQFIGAPFYMSPEQAGSSGFDIDTRTDVYGLGVLLYELLTGKTPFDARVHSAASRDEIHRIIRDVAAPRPSARLNAIPIDERTAIARARSVASEKLKRLIDLDLDRIVMKALEKDRTRRYGTVDAFALDVRRFLSDEPVSAAPPAASYRFRKFARRHRTALGIAALTAAVLLSVAIISTALITAILVAAATVSTLQAVRASLAARAATKAERAALAKSADDARTREDAEAVSEFLIDVFEDPPPVRDGRGVTVAEMLERTAQRFETDRSIHPVRRGKLHRSFGTTYFGLGLYGEAISQMEKARNCLLQTAGLHHRDTLNIMRDLGLAYFEAGRETKAIALWQEVLELFRKTAAPDDGDALRAAGYLAQACQNAGLADDARKLREDVLTLRSKSNGPIHPDTLDAMHELARSYFFTGTHRDKAVKMAKKVLTKRREVLGEQHPDTLWTMSDLADCLAETGCFDEALALREELLVLRTKVLGPGHIYTLSSSGKLADSFISAGRWQDAIALMEEWTNRHPEFSPGHLKLSAIHAWLGDAAGHARCCHRALEIFKETHHAVSAAHAAMSVLLAPSPGTEFTELALTLARRAFKHGPESAFIAQRHRLALGMAEYRNGDDAAAGATLVAIDQKYVDVPPASTCITRATAELYRAMSCFRQNKPAEAARILANAEKQMKPVPDVEQPHRQNTSHHDLICWLAHREAKELFHSDLSNGDTNEDKIPHGIISSP